jgi:hypothetical protein
MPEASAPMTMMDMSLMTFPFFARRLEPVRMNHGGIGGVNPPLVRCMWFATESDATTASKEEKGMVLSASRLKPRLNGGQSRNVSHTVFYVITLEIQ